MADILNTIMDDRRFGASDSDSFLLTLSPFERGRGEGNDYFVGRGGADYAQGGLGSDTLYGGADGDSLYGGAGNDSLFGGAWQDFFYGGNGTNHLFGGTGELDRVFFETLVNISLLSGTGIAVGPGQRTYLSGIEVFDLSPFADRFVGSNARNQVDGGAGADTLHGMGGNDLISTGDGRDIVYGGDGNDGISSFTSVGPKWLYGGAGNDSIYLSSGNELAYGGTGNDYFESYSRDDRSNDSLFGGPGDDHIESSGGNDHLYAGNGHDILHLITTGRVVIDLRLATQTLTIKGASVVVAGFEDIITSGGSSRVICGDRANFIQAQFGNDVIFGMDGNDTILAGMDMDRIFGGMGDDVIVDQSGGWLGGADTYFGGAGRDTFTFNDITCSANETGKIDTISDFTAGVDKIDLRGYFGDPTTSLTRIDYTFIGAGQFTGLQQELQFVGGYLRGDVDLDGRADFALKLEGVTTLTAGDLLL